MKSLLIVLGVFITGVVRAQPYVSISTDVTLMRNFSPHQKFWAFGQSITGEFHFSKKETGYVALVYYSPGRFHNFFIANARSPQTIPSKVAYYVGGEWRMREVSLGWKHYFAGSFDNEKTFNIYGLAGFGLVFTKTRNTYEPVDTSLYDSPGVPQLGDGEFKRLTLDLGIGTELSLGGNFFAFGELKTWLHETDYPSPYLHSNKNVPLPVIMKAGLRILFGY